MRSNPRDTKEELAETLERVYWHLKDDASENGKRLRAEIKEGLGPYLENPDG